MREGHTYRGWRRNDARENYRANLSRSVSEGMEEFDTFKRKSKRHKLFEDLGPKVVQYYTAAVQCLMTSERAQKPKFAAIIKTMKAIAASPTIKHPSLGLDIPVFIQTPRHLRGSWRSL